MHACSDIYCKHVACPAGVVEVSYIDEKEILKTLTERGETCQAFVYIASMAVNPAYRRKGVASAMMQAAEKVGDVQLVT